MGKKVWEGVGNGFCLIADRVKIVGCGLFLYREEVGGENLAGRDIRRNPYFIGDIPIITANAVFATKKRDAL